MSFLQRIMDVVKPHVIQQGEALRLRAKQDLEDHNGM